MKKVLVIGCPGSGKSTFARKLHQITELPLFHLDLLYWNADKTTVEPTIFENRLREVIAQDAWIIDGNYGGTLELRLVACDAVFFLDYALDVCLAGIEARRGKPRSDMPWIEEEADEEFMEFVRSFPTESRPDILKLLEKYPNKCLFIFKDRSEADRFLTTLNKG